MTRTEILRKLLHLVALLIPFGILYLPGHAAAAVLIPVTAAVVAGDVLRRKWGVLERLFLKIFGGLLRPSEATQLTGATWYFVAGLICLFLFDRPVAFTAMAFMIVGDAAAALTGMRFGRIHITAGKSLEGTLACMAACVLFWCLFPVAGFAMALAAAILTGLLEMIPMKINDNLAVPIICGFVLQTGAGW